MFAELYWNPGVCESIVHMNPFCYSHDVTEYRSDINPFPTNALLLYPLKTLENHRFSDIFRGYRSGILVEKGLTFSSLILTFIVNYDHLGTRLRKSQKTNEGFPLVPIVSISYYVMHLFPLPLTFNLF